MYGIFSEAAVIYPLISEHLAAEQLHVGSAMSEGCHRPPSPQELLFSQELSQHHR